MPIKLTKWIWIADITIITLAVITYFWGFQIGDILDPSPHKDLYKVINQKVTDMYDFAQSNQEADQSSKSVELADYLVDNSMTLYGYRLDYKEASLENFDQILTNKKTERIRSGEATALSAYLGTLIMKNSKSQWRYDSESDTVVLKSEGGNSQIDVFDYVYNRIDSASTTPIDFYKESIASFGEIK